MCFFLDAVETAASVVVDTARGLRADTRCHIRASLHHSNVKNDMPEN